MEDAEMAMLLDRNSSQLVVVDVQERLAPSIDKLSEVVANSLRLITAAAELTIPTTLCEQYSRGLGPTVEPLRAALTHAARFEKISFSCMGDVALAEQITSLAAGGRDRVILVGLEAHVCILQTALALTGAGYRPAVVTDAVGSRRAESVEAAKHRLAAAGVELVTTEMVLFEWLECAGTREFRALRHLLA
jgi:nicotinamidase-related amidase